MQKSGCMNPGQLSLSYTEKCVCPALTSDVSWEKGMVFWIRENYISGGNEECLPLESALCGKLD